MKYWAFIVGLLICLVAACGQVEKVAELSGQSLDGDSLEKVNTGWIDPAGADVATRFLLPGGYERIPVPGSSFAGYLRRLPLKPQGALVKYHDGSIKENAGVYEAVVDMDIGKRNLQQCADAVMRLRGEYLFAQKKYEKIHFNFTNGFTVDYGKWSRGYRVKVEGNRTSWVQSASPSNSYRDFRKYMTMVFMYAGTLSLSKELTPVAYKDLNIGDVFIQGGSPGHAVIVLDLAAEKESGKKIFLLAQSYMPAQDIQVLKNPMNGDLSPWYELDTRVETVETPEWTFQTTDLKRFPE